MHFLTLRRQIRVQSNPVRPSHTAHFPVLVEQRVVVLQPSPTGSRQQLENLPAIMDAEIARHGLSEFCVAYQDDLLIFSHSADEHTEHVRKVLAMCKECTLRLHPGKSVIGSNAINFLGFEISQYGLTPQEAKVAAVRAMKAPTSVDEVRIVAGFLNYYRCFVPHYSEIFWCINQLLKKGATFIWDTCCDDAFNHIRNILCTPGLASRRLNPNLPITIYCDWSKKGIGAVCAQTDPTDQEPQQT